MHKKLLGASVIVALTASSSVCADAEDLLGNLRLDGLIELEAAFVEPENGDSSSDFTVATVELGLLAPVNDWIEGEIVFLYEQDETDFGVDSATLSIAPPDGPWFMTGGLFAQPFGRFDTNLVSDPLTLELGEMFETSLQLGLESGGFAASAYVFNGDSNKTDADNLDNFGLDIGYGMESDNMAFSAAAGYLNHIGDTDMLQDAVAGPVADYVAGWFATFNASFGAISVIGEYLGSGDAFQTAELAWDGEGAEPQAWNIEAAYTLDLGGKETTFALGYQGTDQALGLELPESRILAAVSVGVMKDTSLSFEWAHDTDYDVADGGSGDSTNILTAQLAVEF